MTLAPAAARDAWRRLARSGRVGAGVVLTVVFGVAAGFAYQVWQASCRQETTAHFLRATHARLAAREAGAALAARLADPAAGPATRAALATDAGAPRSRPRCSPRSRRACSPTAPSGRRGRAAARARPRRRRRGPPGRAAWTSPRAPAPVGGVVADVRLTPEFLAALYPFPYSWNQAQLLIALVTLTAGGTAVLLLHARRERPGRAGCAASSSPTCRTSCARRSRRSGSPRRRSAWAGRAPTRTARGSSRRSDVESRRLSQLVENVLSFSSAERAMLRLARLPVDSPEVAREAAAAIAPRLPAGRARVVVHAPAPCVVRGDRDALRQVVLNLLDNAVKYGPPGQQVTVRVDARPAAGRRDAAVVLAVEDQGPGIAPACRERVFEPFVRVGRGGRGGDADAAPGYGIGLAVVRHVARLHDAAVAVDDAPGGGARVTLTFPATVALVDGRAGGAPAVPADAAVAPAAAGARGAPRAR
jgi:signal transduction histidine kinase